MVPVFNSGVARILNADTGPASSASDVAVEFAEAIERIDPLMTLRLRPWRVDLPARAVCTAALRELHVQLREL